MYVCLYRSVFRRSHLFMQIARDSEDARIRPDMRAEVIGLPISGHLLKSHFRPRLRRREVCRALYSVRRIKDESTVYV